MNPACPHCSGSTRKYGKDKLGQQRYRCNDCKRAFILDKKPMRLQRDKAILCLKLLVEGNSLLVEGNSIRSTERIADVHRDTILHLIEVIGDRCEHVMEEYIKDVPLEYVQADEIWGFVGKKEGHKNDEEKSNKRLGDAYTFVGMESKTKLVVCYVLGRRDAETALTFTKKLAKAADGRFQLSTDGFRQYVDAVEEAFGAEVDYGQLIKMFQSDSATEAATTAERRYSPGQFVTTAKVRIAGKPDFEKISTSHIERQNLTMRMSMRRLTRLTNAHSKKWANLEKALAIHFAYYNFCRVHQSLRVIPAMEAKITDHIWTLEELLGDILR